MVQLGDHLKRAPVALSAVHTVCLRCEQKRSDAPHNHLRSMTKWPTAIASNQECEIRDKIANLMVCSVSAESFILLFPSWVVFPSSIGSRSSSMPKRTFQPNRRHRSKTHGFRTRMKTKGGRAVISRRRAKGRKRVSVKPGFRE